MLVALFREHDDIFREAGALAASLDDSSLPDWLRRRLGLLVPPITPTFPLLGPLGVLPLPAKWTIEFGAPCPRCVMVTREIDDSIPADRAILRHIVRDLDQNLGVYATVVTPGAVALGDALTLL